MYTDPFGHEGEAIQFGLDWSQWTGTDKEKEELEINLARYYISTSLQQQVSTSDESSSNGTFIATQESIKSLTNKEFVKQIYLAAKKDELKTGVFASITTAQAILESAYGRSVPTDIETGQYSYNLFGIKGTGPAGSVKVWTTEYVNGNKTRVIDKFKAYSSFEESIFDHSSFLIKNKRYKSLFELNSSEEWANGLQKAGYATDPKYAEKLMKIMKYWNLP